MAIALESLNHIALRTQKLDESIRFYTEVLGFKEISRPPFAFRGAWLYRAGTQIHLLEFPHPASPEEIDTRGNHIAFACSDLDIAVADLEARGIEYRRNIIPEWNTNQVFFQDPNGWVIELGYYTKPVDY